MRWQNSALNIKIEFRQASVTHHHQKSQTHRQINEGNFWLNFPDVGHVKAKNFSRNFSHFSWSHRSFRKLWQTWNEFEQSSESFNNEKIQKRVTEKFPKFYATIYQCQRDLDLVSWGWQWQFSTISNRKLWWLHHRIYSKKFPHFVSS